MVGGVTLMVMTMLVVPLVTTVLVLLKVPLNGLRLGLTISRISL